MPPPMTKLIGVQRARSRARAGANRRTLLAGAEPANARAAQSRSGDRKFVTMLPPEAAAMTATMTNSLRRSDRPGGKDQRKSD